MFCPRPKIYLHIVAVTNILCRTKRWLALSFWRGTKCSQIFGWLKKFGPAQNILWPVKGQGIRVSIKKILNWLMYTVPYFIKKKSVINIFHGLQMRVLCIRMQLSLRVWIIQKICHTFSSFIRTDGVSFFKEMHKYSILIKL